MESISKLLISSVKAEAKAHTLSIWDDSSTYHQLLLFFLHPLLVSFSLTTSNDGTTTQLSLIHARPMATIVVGEVVASPCRRCHFEVRFYSSIKLLSKTQFKNPDSILCFIGSMFLLFSLLKNIWSLVVIMFVAGKGTARDGEDSERWWLDHTSILSEKV